VDALTTETTNPEVLRLLELPVSAWSEAFPMLIDSGNEGPIFLIFDSIMLGTNIVTNAFIWAAFRIAGSRLASYLC
jgi:hypothetical protein